MSAQRTTQTSAEVLARSPSNLRATQTSAEVLARSSSNLRATQTSAEVLTKSEKFIATGFLGTNRSVGLVANPQLAPRLRLVKVTNVSRDTTGKFTVLTNRTGGTIHYVVTGSPTKPTSQQIKNGLDHSGNPAVDSGSENV